MKKTLLVIIVAALGLAAGFMVNRGIISNTPQTQVETSAPEFAPAFKLKDLEDKLRSSEEWKGKVVMVNFWASWCPPCVREIPAFIKLQKDYADKGLVIIGIAIDTKQNTADFTDPMDINYPILIGEQEGIPLSQAYGNRLGVLPFTVIVDRQGKIVYTHRSELTYTLAEKVIKPLL
ncbi:MAG: redoxin family protein [Gammaproteobacteria bacterium]|nr:redoxin family protein [Gammaproteobacteria bacterium]MDH5651880.1 redoxin family protein [Gammaproteobacteria bacterium]